MDDREEEVSGKIVEVKVMLIRSLWVWVVQSSPVGDGDPHRQGGGDVGQDPKKGKY